MNELRLSSHDRQLVFAALQTLTSGLAHAVRNPLNAARLQLELLERRVRRRGGDAQLVEPAALAGREIARLTRLLDDFLAFAKPPVLELRDVDLVATCREAIDLERALADRRAVAIALVAEAPRVARVDPERLCQIARHLVRNAIEAVRAGGHVTVDVVARASGASICVADDGPGIPAGVLPRVFEPFFSTKHDGTGMGMAIVHSLVTAHGGHVEIDTSPAGTTLEVVLPLAGPSLADTR